MTGLRRNRLGTETIEVYAATRGTDSPDGNIRYVIPTTPTRTVAGCSVQPAQTGPETGSQGFLGADTYRLVQPHGSVDLSTHDQVVWDGRRFAVKSKVDFTGSKRTAHSEYQIRVM